MIGDQLAVLIFGGVNVIAIGIPKIAGSGHFGFDRRPRQGRALGPWWLLAHLFFGVESAAVHNFHSVIGEVGEKSVVAVLGYVRGKAGFELAEEIRAGQRLVLI